MHKYCSSVVRALVCKLSGPGSILAVPLKSAYYKKLKLRPAITIQMWSTCLLWKIMHYFHLMRTLRQKKLYFCALKMANNTLILKIVIDFVSKVPISPLGNFSQVLALFNVEGSPNMELCFLKNIATLWPFCTTLGF